MENAGRFWCLGLALAALISLSAINSAGAAPRPKLAILPFEINDTSGEVGTSARHEPMLAALTTFVGQRLDQAGLFDVVPQARIAEAVAAVNPGTYLRNCNGCEIDIARRAGADQVMIGWIWKVSSLVLSLHIEIKDVASGRTVYLRAFDFRGDNEKSWQRAVDYMAGTLSQSASAPQPQNLGQ